MSQTPDQKQRYKRATIGAVYTSSTPISNTFKRFSISLSEIDTVSSSSASKSEERLQLQTSKKRKISNTKRTNKRSRTTQSRNVNNDWKIESKESIHVSSIEKQKESLKNKKRADKKRRTVTQSKDTDNEWITELEESIDESLIHSRESIQKERNDTSDEYIQLFESPRSPEKVRDAGFVESVYASPIIQSFRRNLISSKDDMRQESRLMNLSSVSSEVRNLEGTDEDDITFHCTNNQRTYPARTSKKSLERKSFILPTQFPTQFPNTTMSDLLSNEFVENSRDEIFQYSTPSPVQVESTNSSEEMFQELKNISISPGMACALGYSNRASRKWVTYIVSRNSEQEKKRDKCKTKTRKRVKRKQKGETVKKKQKEETVKRKQKEEKQKGKIVLQKLEDVYDQSDETDIEFETGGRDNKRMSLAEFRRKQMNKVFDKLSSTSSNTQ